eukprot:1655262-Rhodomonas_salina.2
MLRSKFMRETVQIWSVLHMDGCYASQWRFCTDVTLHLLPPWGCPSPRPPLNMPRQIRCVAALVVSPSNPNEPMKRLAVGTYPPTAPLRVPSPLGSVLPPSTVPSALRPLLTCLLSIAELAPWPARFGAGALARSPPSLWQGFIRRVLPSIAERAPWPARFGVGALASSFSALEPWPAPLRPSGRASVTASCRCQCLEAYLSHPQDILSRFTRSSDSQVEEASVFDCGQPQPGEG